ncbi:hypothetical protein EHW64_09695 [Erwinia psidii]|uniref:hypothetical protein n=1 Tax=Erwinia psidii TaxID=69224 RepID=UPI00226B23F9|nr:hypothetical protein [Erwinia psidii]MCX8961414.1 hypothetical protein [Erwinia psidii]
MSTINLSSNYGFIDRNIWGAPQPGMGEALKDLFNFFLETCRTYDIHDIDLRRFEFEYPTKSGTSIWGFFDLSLLEYMFNEILFENSNITAVEWSYYHPNMTPTHPGIAYNIVVKFENGYIHDDWMYNLIALAPDGQFRVNMVFSPYPGMNSHSLRKAALQNI